MSVPRPEILSMPNQIAFNSEFTIYISIPANTPTSSIKGMLYYTQLVLMFIPFSFLKVALMDLGFSTHAFHSSSRLVFMEAHLSAEKQLLTVSSPPNNRVYPPGPGTLLYTPCCMSLIFRWYTSFRFRDYQWYYQRGSTGNGRKWGDTPCGRPRDQTSLNVD